MTELTVFDTAIKIFQASGKNEIGAVRLQKLVYFSFGWYAHLTGAKLFAQRFYAMSYGPVVSDLLTAHAKTKMVPCQMIQDVRDIREDPQLEPTPYIDQVIAAVCDYYAHHSGFGPSGLAELSHKDAVWADPWKSKPPTSKRADMSSDDIVDYYLTQRTPPVELAARLPDPQVSVVDDATWEQMLHSGKVEIAPEVRAALRSAVA